MIYMSYTTETKVYNRTGLTSAIIQSISLKSSAEVTTLVEEYILDATGQIREDIEYPIVISGERHIGTGYKTTFDLGPEDDAFATEGSYDPINGVAEVYRVSFGGVRKTKPYPETDIWTDYITPTSSGWEETSNVTITGDTSVKVSGSYSTKMVYSGAGSATFPDNSNLQNLDINIWSWSNLFLWVRSSDITVATYIDLYDKDGNYDTQQINSYIRQNNVGQYLWLDLDTIKDNIDWTSTQLQYFVIRTTGAVTIYVDNLCLADDWAYTAPMGTIHIAKADNTDSSYPSSGALYYVNYGYDPFLASTPRNIAKAAEWWVGTQIVDFLRGAKYVQTDFYVFGETLETDQTFQKGGMLAIRTRMEKEYWKSLSRWGAGSYGWV